MSVSVRFLAVGLAALVTVACSSLHVRPLDNKDARGIPFYLPRQDIVLEELGFDDKGKPAQVAEKRIALVTGPDRTRAFRVANAPHWFANSKFTIERTSGGVVKTVSGESDDQLSETLVELAKIVASAAALDAIPDPDLDTELQAQVAARDALVADLRTLSGTPGTKEDRVKKIEEALTLVRARIAAIKAKKGKRTKGVNPSARTILTPAVVADEAEITTDLSTIQDGDVRVYLIPIH